MKAKMWANQVIILGMFLVAIQTVGAKDNYNYIGTYAY